MIPTISPVFVNFPSHDGGVRFLSSIATYTIISLAAVISARSASVFLESQAVRICSVPAREYGSDVIRKSLSANAFPFCCVFSVIVQSAPYEASSGTSLLISAELG